MIDTSFDDKIPSVASFLEVSVIAKAEKDVWSGNKADDDVQPITVPVKAAVVPVKKSLRELKAVGRKPFAWNLLAAVISRTRKKPAIDFAQPRDTRTRFVLLVILTISLFFCLYTLSFMTLDGWFGEDTIRYVCYFM